MHLVMKKTILILSAIIIGVSSCASDQSTVRAMDEDIARKEAQLDRFCLIFDFGDTVAEGDSYEALGLAYTEYQNAKSVAEKEVAYDKYVEAYSKVYAESMDIIEKRGDK